ncbi:hypothetical protein K8I61_17630, partial [bacterium]|nr:hypothetical protein [bacterium]
MKATGNRQPATRRRTHRIAIAILAALCLFASACGRDPDKVLLFDVFGLIDEFYLTSVTPRDLVENALVGMQKSLAAQAAATIAVTAGAG